MDFVSSMNSPTDRVQKHSKPQRRLFPIVKHRQDRRLMPRRELLPKPTRGSELIAPKQEDDEETADLMSISPASKSELPPEFSPATSRPRLRDSRSETKIGTIDSNTRAVLLQRSRRIPEETLLQLLRPPESEVAIVFSHDIDRRTFDYWRSVAAIDSARFSVPYGYLWIEDFPRISLHSPLMKHMVLAHGYIHESLRASGVQTHDKSYKAMCHYREGLHLMAGGLSQLELLLGAWFGFIYEELKLDQEASMTHIRGAEALLKAEWPPCSLAVEKFKTHFDFVVSVYLAQAMQLYETQPAESQQEQLLLLAEAREELVELIEVVLDSAPDADISDVKSKYLAWVALERSRDAVATKNLNQDALFICFNVAMGLTEWDMFVTHSFREEKNWQDTLDVTHLFLSPEYQQSHNMIDEADLLATLTVGITYLIRCVDNDSCQKQANVLLQKIQGRKAIIDPDEPMQRAQGAD